MIKEFCDYLNAQVGQPYLWGGNGETLKDMILYYASKVCKQSDESTEKMLKFISEKIENFEEILEIPFYDCSGLGVKFLLEKGILKSDCTANSLRKKCTPIPFNQVTAGDFVFLINNEDVATHVGYVVEGKMVVHAFNTNVGIIKEPISARKWAYYRPKFFAEDLNKYMVGDIVHLPKDTPVYHTAMNAVQQVMASTVYEQGSYFVYKIFGECVNITRRQGCAGGWIRKEDIET